HRWSGKYEAHLWDSSCRVEGHRRKGKQDKYLAVCVTTYDVELFWFLNTSIVNISFPFLMLSLIHDSVLAENKLCCMAYILNKTKCHFRGVVTDIALLLYLKTHLNKNIYLSS
ncbi:hypothetical protein ACJX0J_009563, partial [Zea mays]